MPDVAKRYELWLFQPRRKLTSPASVDCIAIVQQSWPECERLLKISYQTRNLDGTRADSQELPTRDIQQLIAKSPVTSTKSKAFHQGDVNE